MTISSAEQFERIVDSGESVTERASPVYSRLLSFIRLMRPHQWTKNGFCLAGALFSGRFVALEADLAALATFGCFCAVSSSVYILNDILDRNRDRQHPKKCLRPIASGEISILPAEILGVGLAILGLAGGYQLGWAVLGCMILYILNNLAYSIKFKHRALVDVMSIAISFVLRLLAGVYAVDELPTTWITLCTFFLAMFLGFGKRRAELADVLPDEDKLQRPVLSRYTVQYLDYLVNSSSTMVMMCYALFCTTSGKNPSLIITVPIVFYAIMHYKRLVVLMRSGEEPERILLKDYRIQLCVAMWLASYFLVMYADVHLFR